MNRLTALLSLCHYAAMKTCIQASDAPAAIGPYSQAVKAGNTLYISGQVPLDPATGKLVEGDIRVQTERVMRNIGAILNSAGYDFGDVVKSTCLLTSMADFQGMNEVYAWFFPEAPPARVSYAVAELPLGARIEIETIAVR